MTDPTVQHLYRVTKILKRQVKGKVKEKAIAKRWLSASDTNNSMKIRPTVKRNKK